MQKSVNIQNNVDFTAGSIVVFQKNRCQMASEEKGEKDMKLRKFMAVILSVAMMTSMMGVTSLADMVNSNEIAMTDILPSQESDEIRQEEKASPSDAEEEVQENIEDDTNLSSSYISARGTKVSPSDAIYVSDEDELREAFKKSGTIILSNPIQLSKPILLFDPINVTLSGESISCVPGFSEMAMIFNGNGSSLTVKDIEIDSTNMGDSDDVDQEYSAIYSRENSKIFIKEGTSIINNEENSQNKYGVSVDGQGEMEGGTVSGFTKTGIWVGTNGKFILKDGEISNIKHPDGSEKGGNGILSTGDTTIMGGTIHDCGIGVFNNGKVNISGGEIFNHEYGIINNDRDNMSGEEFKATTHMQGGVIYDISGTAIINKNRGTFEMGDGSSIEGMISNREGATLTISGGNVEGTINNAKGAMLTINGGSVSGPIIERKRSIKASSINAPSYVIRNDDAKLTISGGTISSNAPNVVAVSNGSTGTFEMTGGEINVSGKQAVAFSNENKTVGTVKFSGGSMYVTGEGSKALDNKGSMDVNNDLKIEENGKAQFAISVSQTIGGNVTVSAQTAEIGTQIAVNVTPDSGYKISDVKVDGVSQGAVASCTFIVIHNHNVEVVFVPKTSSGGGSSSGSGKSAASMQNTISETPGNWTQDAMGWKLLNPSGTAYVNTWARKNSQWYWIGEDSYMKTGWNLISEKWYYLTPVSGEMKTGWIQLAEKWYYLDTDGKMAVNTTTSDGYKVDDQGARIQ